MPKQQVERIIDSRRRAGSSSASYSVPDGRYVRLVDYEDGDVLAKLLNVDGSASGLDADLLDGNHAAAFAAASHTHDDRYYTESEIATLLAGYSETSHTHDAYVAAASANYVDLTDGGETTLHEHPETGINFTDVTTGNVSTTAHGYAPKAVAPASPTLNYLGIANGETSAAWKSASSNPGAAASVLQTDANGYVRVARVGVGMAPGRPLDVTGDIGATGNVLLANNTSIRLADTTTGYAYVAMTTGNNFQAVTSANAGSFQFIVSNSTGGIQFVVSGSTYAIAIDSTGKVGVGTTSPSTRLDIDAGAIEIAEMTAPSAGAANTVRIYAEDNGSGKTRLMALFASGAAQQIAIQP